MVWEFNSSFYSSDLKDFKVFLVLRVWGKLFQSLAVLIAKVRPPCQIQTARSIRTPCFVSISIKEVRQPCYWDDIFYSTQFSSPTILAKRFWDTSLFCRGIK